MLNVENFPKAYVEVQEILRNVEKDALEKIPKNVIDAINKNKDKNYIFKLENDNIDNFENYIMRESKAILAYIYINYWCSNLEKEEILKNLKNNQNIEEEIFSSYNIFDSNLESKEEVIEEKLENKLKEKIDIKSTANIEENNSLVEYKEESLWKKIIRNIKHLFKR